MEKVVNFVKKHLKLVISIFIVVIAIIVGCILIFMRKNINEYKIKNAETYIYFGDKRFDYNTELTLNAESGITKIKMNGQEVDLDSQPIYYKGMDKVIFPQEMSVVYPTTGQSYKIPRFTNMEIQNGTTYIDVSKMPLNNVFIYDGNDLYFFIDDAKVIVGETQVDLSPFSYVMYNYNSELYIYNHRDDQMYYLPSVIDDVFVETNNYKLNLNIDSITYKNKEKLLIKNFAYLDLLK